MPGYRQLYRVRKIDLAGCADFTQITFLIKVTKSWYEYGHRSCAHPFPIIVLEIKTGLLTSSQLFHKFYPFGDGRRNSICFTTTEVSYLVVG